MRAVWLVSLLIACEGGKGGHLDGGPTECPCAAIPENFPACGSDEICGNGVRDNCWTASNTGCHCVSTSVEGCDGTTCEQAGFYGSASACSSKCAIVETDNCESCGPDTLACVERAGRYLRSLRTNGTQLAATSESSVELYNANLVQTAIASFGDNTNPRVTPVTGGWLVALEAPARLVTLSTSGVEGTPTALPESDAYEIELSPAVNGHVLVAWTVQSGGGPRAYAVIANETGAIEVPPFELGDTAHLITTDGTDFFVATAFSVKRVTTTGTQTMLVTSPGFAVFATLLTWHGTYGIVGWADSSTTTLQRFDASGPIGAPVSVELAVTAIADGANLVGLELGPTLNLVSIDSTTGELGASKEVGAYGDDGIGLGLVRSGSEIVVAWGRSLSKGRIARAALP